MPQHVPCNHTADRRRNRANIYDQAPGEAPFTIMHLHEALGKLKKRKAPGPDGLVNELFLALGREGEEILLGIYNDAWEKGNTPQNWAEATVVTIFKGKGTDTDPANYRPISLLNVMYKIYASMIQSRLAKLIEPHLRHTQFGFRSHRSTQQPLFTLRRAMEWSLMTNTPLHCLFLDWKQAFDSIDHTAMLEALVRLGISDAMMLAIASLYETPTFAVRGGRATPP